MTANEFAQVHRGMSQRSVHRIFGTTGQRDWIRRRNGHVGEVRSYGSCDDYGGATVRYRDGRVLTTTGTF